jgi:hypothetical protein
MMSIEHLPLMTMILSALLNLLPPFRRLPWPKYFLWLAMLLERDDFGLNRKQGRASETPATYAPFDAGY